MENQNYSLMNTTVLAYFGDSVYELYVRKHVLDTGQVNADKLHQSAVRYVRAEAQANAIKEIFDSLTEEEQTLVKRARNKKITTKPKNADPVIYKWATAFEALIGYLYLSENNEKLSAIIRKTIEIIEKDMSTDYDRKKKIEK